MAKRCDTADKCVWGKDNICAYNPYMTDESVCPRLLDKYATASLITTERIVLNREREERNG
jgi:hypothetical protein